MVSRDGLGRRRCRSSSRKFLSPVEDQAEEAGRLRGIVHDGEWYHVGTPEQREIAEYEITHGNDSVNSR